MRSADSANSTGVGWRWPRVGKAALMRDAAAAQDYGDAAVVDAT
jgi:hypothetical protein